MQMSPLEILRQILDHGGVEGKRFNLAARCWQYYTAVHGPPPRQRDESDLVGYFAHDLDDDARGLLDPFVI
jgi:hypothetical protein